MSIKVQGLFNLLSGIRCHVCGMALENPKYHKMIDGEGYYWANPKLSPYTEVRLDFCSAVHSTQWTVEQIEAHKNATPDT